MRSPRIGALARAGPVLMIFEDAHWIDPTSLEALGGMVDRIAALPVLLIVTSRPEFVPPWPGRPHVTTLAINRLPPHEIGAMIGRVVGTKHIRQTSGRTSSSAPTAFRSSSRK
jgi:predicted ATPase